MGIPASEIVLLHNMRPLQGEKRPLSEQGIAEGDILLIDRGGAEGHAGAAASRATNPAAAAASALSTTPGKSPSFPDEIGQLIN